MPEPKRDRWGRYKLPHPETGEEVSWTRATTLAKAVDDMTGVHKWEMRHVIRGLTLREDLLALAYGTDIDEKKQMHELADQAKAASQAGARANLGTALHKFTQRIDQGQQVRALPAYTRHVDAYKARLARAGIRVNPDWVERITVVPELSVAGTTDRIATYDLDGKRYIADLKTGHDLTMGQQSIAVQLALYAHGAGLWDELLGKYDPMPEVDQERGIVIHLPAETEEDTEPNPVLYWVDIAAGWEAAKLCHAVREWRKRKDLFTTIEDTEVA